MYTIEKSISIAFPSPKLKAPMIASDSAAGGSFDTSLYQTLSQGKRSAGPPFAPPPPPQATLPLDPLDDEDPAPLELDDVPLDPLDAPLDEPPLPPVSPPLPHAQRIAASANDQLRILSA
jgi:hypothetical protein